MKLFPNKLSWILALFVVLLTFSTTSQSSPILKWRLPKKEIRTVSRPKIPFHPKPGQVWKDPYLGMEFVWVPGGCYKMGCGWWTSSCSGDEKPVHEVCVDGFWMGKHEVTFDQYDRFCEETGREKPDDGGWGRGRRPVINVSWHDAKAFANWLSQKTGYKFRLPTEAEWEYACRSGGKDQMFAGFSDVSQLYRYANFCDRNCPLSWKTKEQDDGYSYSAHVGSYTPNGLGIYDMSGNVWEWCEDWYDKNYYTRSPAKNPRGPSRGAHRVIRGGCWLNNPRLLRCANRLYAAPDDKYDNLGFRLLRQ